MLTFAISLLMTAAAAFALFVVVAMIAVNGRAIVSALAGKGAFHAARTDAAGCPPRLRQVRVGKVRRGRIPSPQRPFSFSHSRAAA